MSSQFLRLAGVLAVLTILMLPANALADGGTWHVVAAGETLSLIAARYGVTVDAIVAANGLSNPNAIYAGQRLFIPMAGQASGQTREHIVDVGESLTSIASMYGISVKQLAIANGLKETDYIFAGQVLVIPASQQSMPAVGTGCMSYHTVQPADTLTSIGARYGVSVGALMAANNLPGDTIYAGQHLCVPSDAVDILPPANVPTAPVPTAPPSTGPIYSPPPATTTLTPPEYKPYPESVTYPTTPPSGQPLQPPGYQPYPSLPTVTTVESAPLPQYAPPAVSIAMVRPEETWLGSQTADPLDPDRRTTLLVMVWDGKGKNVVVRGDNGFAGRRTADVNFEFSWVPTVAFRDIPPGNYEVFLEGENSRIARAQVQPGHRPLVEFKEKAVTPEGGVVSAAAGGPAWVAEVVENTNGDKIIGAWSILVVRTGTDGQVIRVTAPGGFETTCITGSKPEYGPGACDIGGLHAGTYQVILDSAGIGMEIYLDGAGRAKIDFRPI
jgi:LysM repeat protein